MFIEILLFLFFGMLLGIITGLAPGIHPNLIVLAIPSLFVFIPEPILFLVFVVSMAVTNSIVDFIPSILLGAPDADTALSALPGHRLLLQGQGYHAIRLTTFGCLASVAFVIILSPLLVLFIPIIYATIKPVMAYALISMLAFLVYKERNRLDALMFILIAGLLGLMSMQIPLSSDLILFPLLTGLFGFSLLLEQLSQKSSMPAQDFSEKIIPLKIKLSSIKGTLAGLVSGLLPGVGPSQAVMFTGETDGESFLVRLGAISTANILLSFLALWLISQPRSGVAVAVGQLMNINTNEFILILVLALVSSSLAAIFCLKSAKAFMKGMQKINYSKLSALILLFLNIIVLLITGIYGLMLAWTAAMLGLACHHHGLRRSLLMASLILPTILFYFGF
ncbi:MAG: tripartite tricarboxylate transporter permease [Candidatus Aenigmatarchaeota archaeon]